MRTFRHDVVAVSARTGPEGGSDKIFGDEVCFVDLTEITTAGKPDLVWLAVPDNAIPEVIKVLVETVSGGSPIPAVLHSSGSLGTDVLEPVARLGALTGALHPNLIIDGTEPFPSRTIWGVTGSPPFLELSRRLLSILDPQLVLVSEQDRALYHVAATLTANYPILLADLADGLYRMIGLSHDDSRGVVSSYLRSVADRVERSESSGQPIDLMTGPIVRGDRETLEGHVKGLRSRGMQREAELLEALIGMARIRLENND
jgi:predicted short-subunit dehydrogenase-like oxidoreductase (DUF2520 family)